MAKAKRTVLAAARRRKAGQAVEILQSLGFGSKQCNEVSGYTLLALLNMKPT